MQFLKMNGLIVILVKEERYVCIYFNPLNQVYEALGITHCIMLMKIWNHPLYQVDLYIDILVESILKLPEFVDLYIDILTESILKLLEF